jgi:hypothetical protein
MYTHFQQEQSPEKMKQPLDQPFLFNLKVNSIHVGCCKLQDTVLVSIFKIQTCTQRGILMKKRPTGKISGVMPGV